ncbi:hypothetical protein [Gemella morbillorum]|uniref:hypothetical protein n=1 Tax=Gemella morbillorum TaxID=29391 RepID=UPI00248F232D|nr:hypothetical protein [Gemella morbillorum]
MTEFKVIETQEELNEIIKKRLEREKSKYADYDTLSEKIKTLETEKIKLEETIKTQKETDKGYVSKIAELEQTISGWESKALKQKVAIKHNLPFELANRLQGDSEESLEEDAERLASLMTVNNNKTYTQPLANVEPESTNGTDAAWKGMLNILK